ncbi:MAG: hypothetical protein JST30_02095 [Armatimonadetes bacterium]|nr:hypothetical protein [Armatimonadota bacterium]
MIQAVFLAAALKPSLPQPLPAAFGPTLASQDRPKGPTVIDPGQWPGLSKAQKSVKPSPNSPLPVDPENVMLVPDARPKAPAEVKAKPTGGKIDDSLCSLEVTGMDPAQILQALSIQTGANLILLAKPDAKLTLRLTRVPLSEMVRHICAMCELSFIRIGETYVIATADKLKAAYGPEWSAQHPEPALQEAVPVERVTETYVANYATSSEIIGSLSKLFPEKELTLVSGPNPITPLIGQQDSSKATGTETSMLEKGGGDAGSSRVLVVSGPRDLVAKVLETAKSLDRPRKQVAIAVTIHDISNDALREVGITWNLSDVTTTERGTRGINFGSFDRSPLSIANQLSIMEKKGQSKLLASPNVSVLDGERAFVLIGNRINYPVLVGYSQNNAPIFSKEEERVGIYLQVSPSIGEDGTVTLSLYPQVSTITGYLTVNGASYPQISTREAQTTLRVKSGATIVMGGLISDEDIAAVQKVPLLSEIPLLGELFKHRKVTKTKSQVIITVTPLVIAEPAP